MVCDYCEKEIPRGEIFYHIPGLIYKCCSKGCLLSVYTNYETGVNTGQEEDDD